ncbi:hypothetical protein B0T18DRAFT_484449 [Schizothecium vesticola]|uniref:Protein YAE1 n=1 Tax=Schizothecium vesticola TaxID=314040 RepID=A0AA40F9N9_9PEZI|nr:hypothetical protein B0T18DRAFT_484449 [Schizothecium vesticola]
MLLRQSPPTPDPDLYLTMSTTTTTTTTPHTHPDHPSDIPRLQQSHTTAGYRDGITTAKASSVQPGFDEGFSLGATIGSRAGDLVGVLEGVVSALSSHSQTSSSSQPGSPLTDEIQRVAELLEQARKELSVQVVFGKEYWEEDGTWKYDVPGAEEGGWVLFADVAAAHPMLAKWEGVVKVEAERNSRIVTDANHRSSGHWHM